MKRRLRVSDDNGVGSFSPGGDSGGEAKPQPIDNTPSTTEDTGNEEQPKYITEDALNERLAQIERKVQSSRDSALSTFDKRIKGKIQAVESDIEAWRKQGVKITPEQEQQRRLNALQEAMMENPDATNPSSQPTGGTGGDNREEIVNKVNAQAYQIAQQAGVELEQDDPELMLIDQSSPQSYLASYRNALYQKKLRAGANAKPPEARIPSMGQATKAPAGLAEQFLQEYKAAQGKGLQKARDIRKKFRDRGVDVRQVISDNF